MCVSFVPVMTKKSLLLGHSMNVGNVVQLGQKILIFCNIFLHYKNKNFQILIGSQGFKIKKNNPKLTCKLNHINWKIKMWASQSN